MIHHQAIALKPSSRGMNILGFLLIFSFFATGLDLWMPDAKASAHGISAPASGLSHPWPHSQSDLSPDPAVTFGTLDNGFRYVFMRNTTPPERVALHLVVLAGSVHEMEDEHGAAHFLEHMLFNGTAHFKPGDLVRYFNSIGMLSGW